MTRTFNNCTPKSSLGKAISYVAAVNRYCKDRRFQIDNNGMENAIRPIALGRKNYLFAGNDSAAEGNCIFYTLLGSCKEAGIDPMQWLSAVIEIIPTLQTPIDWEKLLHSNFHQNGF